MKNNNTKIGERYITNQGYEVEIVEYIGSKNVTIKLINMALVLGK